MKTQLLCTFTTQHNLEQSIRDITKNFKVVFDKIYVLQNEEKQKELICTYNVNKDDKIDFNSVNNTISLHRKKITNTLYTINALNTLIKELNGGVLDTSYRINWPDYRNCILLTKGPELKRINTKLYRIEELEN